jgi:serine/threonine protein kinase
LDYYSFIQEVFCSMSVTHSASQSNQSDELRCSQCDAVLVPDATNCGSCGAHIETSSEAAFPEQKALSANGLDQRYHITGLLRSQPTMRLLLAYDTQLCQPVMIRDVIITQLDAESKQQALQAIEEEHAQLQPLNTPYLMSPYDLYSDEQHIYSISRAPAHFSSKSQNLITLGDLLQSGIGLPAEQVAISWICYLCQALDRLHVRQIVMGDLDPQAIILSSNNYEGWPALGIAWLPAILRSQLPHVPATTHFSAPEVLFGEEWTPAVDIYSLGALLYLFLTGSAPEIATQRHRVPSRAPREIDPQISINISAVTMRALAFEHEERYSNVRQVVRELLMPPVQSQNGFRHSEDLENGQGALLAPLQNGLQVLQEKSRRLTGKLRSQTQPLNPSNAPDATYDLPSSEFPPQDYSLADEPTIRMLAILPPSKAQVLTLTAEKEKDEAAPMNSLTHTNNHYQTGEHPKIPDTPRPDKEIVPLQITIEMDESLIPGTYSQENVEEEAVPTERIELVAQEKDVPTERIEPVTHKEDIPTEIFGPADEIPTEQFQTATNSNKTTQQQAVEPQEEEELDEETQHLAPLQAQMKQQAADGEKVEDLEEETQRLPHLSSRALPVPYEDVSHLDTRHLSKQISNLTTSPAPLLPSTPTAPGPDTPIPPELSNGQPDALTSKKLLSPEEAREQSLLKRLQRFFLGEQQHTTTAAALIETPLRIQPAQAYSIRVHLMGRSKQDGERVGLSGMLEGELVHIEVRSALPHRYAYIVQRAQVRLPAAGYAAEVTIPMRPLPNEMDGRRERLYVHFLDDRRYPLYEKPFTIEIYVSHLVQAGREGHNVLPIPI